MRELSSAIPIGTETVRLVTRLEIYRLALGFKRPRMAAAIEACAAEGGGMCADTLRRYEHRLTGIFDLFASALCTQFKVGSVAMLGIGKDSGSVEFWTWMTEEQIMAEIMHRRQLLQRMGVAGAAAVAGKLLPVPPLVASAQALGVVGGRNRGIGAGQVITAQDTATNLAIAYRANPGEVAVRAAEAHAYTLLDLLKPNRAQMGPSIRTQLQSVASDAAALAGYGHLNAGRLDIADAWFTYALDLAREAGDRRLEALALASRGWVFVSDYGVAPDPAAAIAAFRSGAELYPFLPPAERAWMFGELAIETAAAGDDVASGRFLEHAQTSVARLHYQQPGWGWWSTRAELGGWDGAKPEVFAALRALRLGRPAEALEGFDALPGRGRPGGYATRHVHVMEACAALGDADQACGAAHTALDIATAYDLGSVPLRVRTARAGFPAPLAGASAVRELDERLRLAA